METFFSLRENHHRHLEQKRATRYYGCLKRDSLFNVKRDIQERFFDFSLWEGVS